MLLICVQGPRALLEFGKVFRFFLLNCFPATCDMLLQVGLLHFVLSSMRITDISDDEITSLIGADPALGVFPANTSIEDKQQILRQMADENEAVVSEFRSLQVLCVAHARVLHMLLMSRITGGRCSWSNGSS